MGFRANEAGICETAQAVKVDHHFFPSVDAADMTRQHSRIGGVRHVAYQRNTNLRQRVIARLPQQQDVRMAAADEYQFSRVVRV
jgi:hypothetical protein